MNMFKPGDRVAVLDDAYEGVVLRCENDQITLETSDGFVMTYFVKELIKNNVSSELDSKMKSFNSNSVKSEKEMVKRKQNPVAFKTSAVIPAPEFDLHIEKLVPRWRHMSNYEILNLQMETAKRHVEFAIKNRIPKIIFIHGVGEGVLKSELDFMLGRYEEVYFQDANYQKYGQGATEVGFRQKK